MTITFKADIIRQFIKEELSLYGFESLLKQEVNRIVESHRTALIQDLQKLAVNITTNESELET